MRRNFKTLSRVLVGVALLAAVGLTTGRVSGQADSTDKKPAVVKVQLPQANATLKIENTPTKQAGKTRTFVTPPLDPGRNYSYTLVVTWAPNNYTTITRTKEVAIRAGGEIEADLTQADDKHPDDIVIRYVPTPPDIVAAMCKLAGVGKDDVVYDLGCGDGRIVAAAVKDFNAKHGVGIDLDPERVKDSLVTVKEKGVEGKVDIRKGDVLMIDDLSDATVVMLYMGNDLNMALRPILWKKLKPGTRVVSHRFTMGDWKPDTTEKLKGKDGDDYLIHLWTIKEDMGK